MKDVWIFKMESKLKYYIEKVQEIMGCNLVYAVGGCVRDHILGIEPKDYDFCTPIEPDEIERLIKVSGRRVYLTGKRFGTLACKIDGEMIEITTFRAEKYELNNRKPTVEYVKTIDEDLSRRDFTINAIAMRLVKGKLKIIDPFGGQEDLKNGIIKCVGNSKTRFKEDPLRILRAIRFATRFKFTYEEKTVDRIKKMKPMLLTISKERIVSELDKILIDDNVEYGLEWLFCFGTFKFIIPELSLQWIYKQNSKYHDYCLHLHTVNVVKTCPKDINLRWAALLHDIAKPFVRTDKLIDEEPINGIVYGQIKRSNYIDHEKLGADMALRIALHLKFSKERREFIVDTIANHLNEDCVLKKYDDMNKKK